MALMNVAPFRPAPNTEILNALRGVATDQYQARIPHATRGNLAETAKNIMDYTPTRNEFISALVNRIGRVIARNNSWSNPLAKFKIGLLEFGDTIEEINTGLVNAYVYDDDREYMEKTIFGTERPEVQSSFHTVNRRDFYKITVNNMQLRRAFLNENGLSEFISTLMAAPMTSDNWDEFLLMTRLFRENYDNGGFFRVKSPDISVSNSTPDDARAFLRLVREYSENLSFISRDYNAAGMPVSANIEDLELFITPSAKAAIDVDALAAAFNIGRADVSSRMTVIPQERFNIPGTQAILTTKDFFVVADNVLETTEQYNPVTLGTNFFLHHQQVISMSRFVPAIIFNSLVETDKIEVITGNATAITGKLVDGDGKPITTVTAGEMAQIEVDVKTDNDDAPTPAVTFAVTGTESSATRVTNDGVLHVGIDETAKKVAVVVTAAENHAVSTTVSVPVTPGVSVWPRTDRAGVPAGGGNTGDRE